MESSKDLLESLWPLVEQANQQAQGFGCLMKSKIAIVQPGDFVRAPKGTIVRSATAEKLSSETGDAQLKISQLVKDCVYGFEKLAIANDEDDLFHLGLDSLIAIELAKSIRTELSAFLDRSQLSFIMTIVVFRHCTIKGLSEAISSNTDPQQATNEPAREGRFHILLIGSTGFLGQHLFATLIQHPEVTNWCSLVLIEKYRRSKCIVR